MLSIQSFLIDIYRTNYTEIEQHNSCDTHIIIGAS